MSQTPILIVEDEAIVAADLTNKLEQLGYAVVGTTATGETAIEMIGRLRPHLVLMDIHIEGFIDGIETAEEIRQRADIPVVYLTAHSDPATLKRAKITGPFGYILKPFDARDLATQIELALYKHQIERQLREQREWLRVTLKSIGDAVVATDAESIITFLNPAAEWLTGWPAQEATGKPLNEVLRLIDEKNRLPVDDPVRRVLASGNIIYLTDNTVLLCRDGQQRSVDDSAAPIRDEKGRIIGVVLILRDITERRETEERHRKLQDQLAQAQKMESVGRLAGGVAHDFNNMLGAIIGHAELAMHQLEPSSRVHSNLEQILTAAQRSADLTRQLLAFARKQTIAPRVVDLDDTITDMIKMLRRLIGEDIDLAWLPGANLWSVKIDPAQTDQLLANLCVNARDAIDGVGKISIETKNMIVDARQCSKHPECQPGRYVMLAVSDNGHGMDEETLANLFEPFFTTKGVGQGTGLGLSTVYGIVKQNNGFIEVYSEPGQGATFQIYLPSVAGQPEAKTPTDQTAMQRGEETVLVVEDEQAILRLAKAVLERLGYTVLAVSKPDEALAMVAEQKPPIDLIITDVVMPEMNGQQLMDRIRQIQPDVKVLFMSGYTADAVAHRGILEADVNFLQKPFTNQALARKVREVLTHE